jgi:ABC-type dipeptide/oligopeptide/nickel transport system permease component
MRHALKNAVMTVVTIIALDFGLLTGALVTETLFRWLGVGLLLVVAIQTRDFAIIQMVVLVTTVTYILVNLAADIAYGYLNPRIRNE